MTPENQKLREALKVAENIIVSALAHQPDEAYPACNQHLMRACKDVDRVICRAIGMPFSEEVFCSECGKKLDNVKLHMFGFNGSEYEYDDPVDFTSALVDDGTLGICICTDTNWCGYDQCEEDQAHDIRCPHCGKFPFASKHIEVEESNQVMIGCWTEPRKPDPAPRPASAPQGKEKRKPAPAPRPASEPQGKEKVVCVKCGQPVPISKAEDWDVSGSTRRYICPSCAAEEAF